MPVISAQLYDHMKNNGVKKLGYIGFSDAWGELWLQDLNKSAEKNGVDVVAVERYGRTDRNVNGQVLKLLASRPDAVLIGGSGTPRRCP